MTVDRDGNAYVPGITDSEDFPTTPHAFQPAFGGVTDGYLAKLNPRGTGLMYATYSAAPTSTSAAASASTRGARRTWSASPPRRTSPSRATRSSQPSPARPTRSSSGSTTGGSRLRFSTFLGGSGDDGSAGAGEWLDDRGNFYVPGFTNSPDFPVTPGAFQSGNAGGSDIWLAKIAPSKHRHKGDDDVLRARRSPPPRPARVRARRAAGRRGSTPESAPPG